MLTSDSLSKSFAALPYLASFLFGTSGGGLVGSIIVSRARGRSEKELAALRNDYEASNRKLQAQLDRASGVHRLRVEKEFKQLTDVWDAVVATRRTMGVLRPVFDVLAIGEDPGAAFDRRFPPFIVALEQMKSATFAGHPFFPAEISKKLTRLIKIASAEYFDMANHRRHGEGTPEWFDAGEKRNDQYGSYADEFSILMRARLDELSQA
jgi:hypothetical protein